MISFLGPLGPVFSDKIKTMQLQLLSMAESIPVDLLSTMLTAMSETIYRNSVQNIFKDSAQDMFKDMKKDDSVEKQFSAILEEEEEEYVIEKPIKSEEVDENSSNYEVHTTVQETTYSIKEDDKLQDFIQNELVAEESENTLNDDKSIDEPSSVETTEAIVESISENRADIFEKSSPEKIVVETIEIMLTSEPVIEEVLEEINQEIVEEFSIIEEVVEISDTNKDEVPNQDQIKEEIEETKDIAIPQENVIEHQELKEAIDNEPSKEIVEVKTEIELNSSEKHEYTVQEKAHDLETFHDAVLETNIHELVPVNRLKRFQKKFEDNSVFVSIKVKKSDEKVREPEVIENVPIIQEVLESFKKHAAEQEAIIQEALIEKIVQEEIVKDEETVIDEIPNEIPIEDTFIEINEPNEITVELTFPNSNETNKDVMEDSMSSSYTSDLSDKVTDVVFLQPKIKDNVDFYENYELNFTKNIDSANDFMKNKSINQRLFNQQKVKTLDQSWQQLCENQKKVYK